MAVGAAVVARGGVECSGLPKTRGSRWVLGVCWWCYVVKRGDGGGVVVGNGKSGGR